MRKCGLYVRVSTDLQTDPEGSLKSQQQRLEEELKIRSRNGEDWKNVGVYIDAGLSGKDTQRPELKRLLADIAAGTIDTIVCSESSRISRSLEDFIAILKHLETYEGKFVSLKEPHFDTSGPVGNLIIRIMASVNQFERENTAQRTSDGMQARARRGLWNGGPTPLGYDIIPERKGFLTVNADEAEIVKLAFSTYLETESIQKTADELNSRGYSPKVFKSRRGRVHAARTFHKMSVGKMLSNWVYVGKKELNAGNEQKDQAKLKESKRYGIVKTEAWQPIIDESLFERVQRIILQNGQSRRSSHKVTDFVYLLSGILRCPTCDVLLEGSYATSKTGARKLYYRHPSGSRKDGCELPSVPAEMIEGIIVGKLKDLSLKENLLQQIVERAGRQVRSEQPELQKLLDSRRKELRAIDDKVNKLVSLSDTDSIRDVLRPQLDEMGARRKVLEKEITNLENGLHELKGNLCSSIDLRNVLSSVRHLFDVLPQVKQKELLGYMLDAINITPKSIEVRFWNKSPMLDAARNGIDVGSEAWFEQCIEWLPGQDSNLQPCG